MGGWSRIKTINIIENGSHGSNYKTISLTSGQSYKHFTLVNYDSRVVIWGIFQSGMTLES